jgi:hypothetical protein
MPHVSLPLRHMGLSPQRTIYKKFVILSPACSSAAGNCRSKDLCISPSGVPHMSRCLCETWDSRLSAQSTRGAPCLAALARHGILGSAHNLQEVCHPEPRVLQRGQHPSREGPVHFAVRGPHVSLPLRDMGLSPQSTIYKKFVILSPACSSAARNCRAKDLCISPSGDPMSRCPCETPRASARRAAIPRRTPAFCNSPRLGFSHNFSTPYVTNNLYLKF